MTLARTAPDEVTPSPDGTGPGVSGYSPPVQIGPWTFRTNAGMAAAAVLLVAGGAMFLAAGDEDTTLRTVGFGLIVASSVVYIGARVVMLVRERRP